MTHFNTICQTLRALRLSPQLPERAFGDAVAAHLQAAGIAFVREAPLAAGCRADFWCPLPGDPTLGVVLELKRNARVRQRANIAQLRRYLACETTAALVLVAERTCALPATLGGAKPVACVSVRRAWGVAV